MRTAVLVLVVVVVAVVPALAADQAVTANDFQFAPTQVAVKPGEKVTWTNAGGQHNVHFVEFDFQRPADPELPAGWPNPNEHVFNDEGTFHYYCEFHGNPSGTGMSGVVYVNQSGTVPSPSPTATTPPGSTPTPTPTPTPTTGSTPGATTTPKPGTSPTTVATPVLIGGKYVLPTFRVKAAKRFCIRPARRCRRPGVLLRLTANASFTVRGTLFRGRRRFGTLRLAVRRGTRAVRFQRTTDRKRLRAGRYRLVLMGAGLTRTVRFTIRSR